MSIFSIGLSGLNSAQIALHTTSNNISNVYTPGYNRELTLFEENKTGGGARISDVQRQYDYFIATQLNSARSGAAALSSYQTQISQIDNLLADAEAGLSPIMQSFFSALQDLSANPADPAARQGVIGTADTLTAQFRSLDRYLADIQEGIATQINSEVTQINNVVGQIAKLNEDITLAKARNGDAPNALLNQRDQLVAELGERINVSVHIQGSSYNITVGNGQPLVAGTQSYTLGSMRSSADPSRIVVGYTDSAGNDVELSEGTFTKGTLGGLMSFRSESLDKVQNHIGHLAASLALAFNEQHEAGTDLVGDPGTAFFSVPSPHVNTHERNNGTAIMTADFADHLQLEGEDYRLVVSDAATGEFLVSRLDGSESFNAVLDGANQLNFAGLQITIDDPALLADGDSYQVLPTRKAAGSIENLIQDTGRIAAGFSGESGDNENALALQALQDARVVGGTSTLSQSYASLVGEVGNRTNIVQVNLQAQQSLTEQIHMVQQSESGVNLDEEAANLIRFQQYYQANAKVIEVGASLFDTLLGLRA